MSASEEPSMSTFDRMLKVLGNRDGGYRDGSVATVLSRVLAESRSGAGRRARRRASSRRGRRHTEASFSTEQLEQRQLLAVSTFVEPSINGGWVSIVAEGGDNVYVQANAGNPNSLRVADNSSFTNSTVVGGPVGLGGSSQLLPGVNIDSIKMLNITSGTLRRDADLYARGYPMVQPNVTRFALSGDGLNLFYGTLRGRLSIVQPDGRTESWDFSQPDRNKQPTFTSGIDSTTAKPGDYYPTAIQASRAGSNAGGNSEIEVSWNVPQLPLTNVPTLNDVQWRQSSWTWGSPFRDKELQVTEPAILPAAPTTTFIPLPRAAGLGLNEIIASTFQSTLMIQGKALTVTTSGTLANPNQLMFNGNAEGVIRDRGPFEPNNRQFVTGRLVTGVGDPVYGTERGIELSTSGAFAVQLESARYAMPGGGAPVTATIFNGQDIHAALNVNLVQPGSTFNIDSPVAVTAGYGGITLRATNVTFNAEVSTKEDLTIGAAVVSSAQAWERATAIAQIVNGAVSDIKIPSGMGGAGFDADDPPIVTIAAPGGPGGMIATARAIVDPSTTRIVRIETLGGGSGYTSPPDVQIAAPVSAGNAARPLAVVNAQGQVSSIDFQKGENLKVRVTGVDKTGAVTSAIVINNGGGKGYAVGDIVIIDSGAGGVGQSAQFKVLEVNSVGGGVRIEIVKGGKGYGVDEVLTHAGAEGRGYGYKFAPRVWISRPAAADGVRAEAVATIDSLGRISGITLTNKGSGYLLTAPPIVTIGAVTTSAQAETVRLNARVAAANYSFTLADEPVTTDVPRSTLLVSNTGSLAGSLDGTSAASTVMIESRQGDVLLEGLVNAANQSYILQSNPEDQWLQPFRLTTKAAGSSVPTGLIRGNVVAVTLANDLETPTAGAVAYSQVELQTQVNSLRVRASRRDGSDRPDAFPYALSVKEVDDISIDSVASSSFPIDLSSVNGGITLRAALVTAGGLVITTPQAGFKVTAPVSTTKGQIDITAQSITVGSSLQVTDSDRNEAQEDIVLHATAGDIVMNGGVVSGRNRVSIKQQKLEAKRVNFVNKTKTTIPSRWDNKAPATSQVTVPFLSVNDIDVEVSITHPYIASLSAVLIHPNGTRIPLFNNSAVGGANLINTTFDSEAASLLANTTEKAPYTASFRPVGNLAALYAASPQVAPVGTWTLEVRDSYGYSGGSIDSFTLSFRDPAGQPGGTISGTSRIKADTLSIDASGSVGKAAGGPGSNDFYLQTDVNTVIGYCLGSFAISDVDDLFVNSLGAAGLVSLRAEGVDPEVNGTTGLATKAALRGNLRDVTAVEVSAPNGSISLDVNTANDVVLGNARNLALAKSVRSSIQPPMKAAGSVRITAVGNSTGGSFQVLDAPLAGSSARSARFAMTVTGTQAVYDAREPGRYAGTLIARAKGSLTGTLPNVKLGNRILINNAANTPATPNARQMNGVYAVTALGDAATPWQLTRVPDSDTAAEFLSNTIVVVNDGSGGVPRYHRVTYPTLGSKLFGTDDITVVEMASKLGTSLVSTSIGSTDASDSVNFVVATTDETNDSPGSLGKMIRLRQENIPEKGQEMNFLFSSSITKETPINLEQELPIITKAFAIDGKQRYSPTGNVSPDPDPVVIDGSRIRTTRYNELVGLNTAANGIVFASSSGSPTAGAGASLSNVFIGGFNQQDEVDNNGTALKLSAAIIVDGASNVTMDGIVVGENGAVDAKDGFGVRVGSVHGIVVRNAGGAANGAVSRGVTVKNSRITAAATAGVSLEGGTAGALLYGNVIGLRGRDNGIGINVEASGADNSIGSVTEEFDTKKIPLANTISFNTTGIVLAGSDGATVINSVITSNNNDGIVISAGNNVIGSNKAPDPLRPLALVANQIAMNKGWGVKVQAATQIDAASLAKNQKIFGNYFVVPEAGKNDTSKQNQAFKGRLTPAVGEDTAVGVTASTPGAAVSLYQGETLQGQANKSLAPYPTDYVADRTKAGLDPSGNQHFGIGDNVGPVLTMLQPVDVLGSSLGSTVDLTDADVPTVRLKGTDASSAKAFVLSLQDLGSGVLTSTIVKEAFVVKRDSSPLVEGKDYKFSVSGTASATLRFETIGIGTFPLGTYQIEAKPSIGSPGTTEATKYTFTGGKLTDKANNIAQKPVMFAITLASAQAPTDVVAVAGDGAADISWKQPASDGGAEITGYVIQSSVNSGGTWVDIVPNTNSSITSAVISGLTNGTTYLFRVAAITAAGRGVFSANASAVKPGLQPPGKPTAMASGGSVTLGWTAPVATPGIVSYAVQQSVDDGKTWTNSTFTQPS
jgi:subtilisin-like proprotein convertase family protein